jgi:hypothetical protein
MSLLTEALELAKPPSRPCGVFVLRAGLPESEQAELDEALRSRVSANALANALTLRKHAIGYQTIQRHRQGVCSCPR